jgi:two-component system, NtrC family, sensor kinase
VKHENGGSGSKPGPPLSLSGRAPPSLRLELVATLALLATASLLVAVVCVLLFTGPVISQSAAIWLSVLIAADVAVFVAFGAYQLRRLVNRPLDEVVGATEAIAGGDLSRRVPPAASAEFAQLANSVNRMTDRLLEEQAHRTRAEKMATVGRLAAGIAHEIGNPLGAINGYSHILRNRMRDDALVQEAADGLDRESARIDRIVRGLLDYARPRRLTPTPIDLNDTVRSVVDLLTTQGVLKRIEVRLDLDARDPKLFGERHEVEQVFVNVILNAVSAMDGAGTIAILTRRIAAGELAGAAVRRSVDGRDVNIEREPDPRFTRWLERVGQPADAAQIIVADSGPGVSAADAERIFDPFFTTKPPGKGTGLGLAIVARVVENLNGMVWVQRAREGGAAFVIVFPALKS